MNGKPVLAGSAADTPRNGTDYSSHANRDANQAVQDLELHRAPGYLFRRLDSLATTSYEVHTGQSTLTPRQFGLMVIVHQAGVIRQSDLGRRLHLDPSTLGEMLVRMVERGLLSRRAARTDRRTSEIELTDDGRETLFALVEGALDAQKALLAPLPDYLRPVFLKCLEMLAYAEDAAEADQEL